MICRPVRSRHVLESNQWNEWGARAANAVAFAVTVLLVLALGRRMTPARPWLAALVCALTPLAVVVFLGLVEGRESVRRLFDPRGLLTFVLVGFSWYAVVLVRRPELLRYFLQDEAVSSVPPS